MVDFGQFEVLTKIFRRGTIFSDGEITHIGKTPVIEPDEGLVEITRPFLLPIAP